MNENDQHEIFDFIVDPEWEDVGAEITTNAFTYYRLIESGSFEDMPKGSYVLIIHGNVLKYYEKDISSEDYEEFEKKYWESTLHPSLKRLFYYADSLPMSVQQG